ncbi:MAG: radical SAM protein, partial [Desulfobacteraceae bacterium]|nr:radical SAM protein [Desulfobacteraceae bacterium]
SSALPLDDRTSRLAAVTLLRLARILNFIKNCIDTHGRLPLAQAFVTEDFHPPIDRDTISHKLLQWFLDDGIIRGVDNKGNLYTHKTDLKLCQKFIRKIKQIPIMGVEKGPLNF